MQRDYSGIPDAKNHQDFWKDVHRHTRVNTANAFLSVGRTFIELTYQ